MPLGTKRLPEVKRVRDRSETSHGGQLRRALLRHDRKGAQTACLDLPQSAAQRGDHQCCLSADDIREGRRRAAVGDEDRLDANTVVEARAGEVPHRAKSGI